MGAVFGYELVAQALKNEGADTMFFIMGGPMLGLSSPLTCAPPWNVPSLRAKRPLSMSKSKRIFEPEPRPCASRTTRRNSALQCSTRARNSWRWEGSALLPLHRPCCPLW
jgi:hypothetical protein